VDSMLVIRRHEGVEKDNVRDPFRHGIGSANRMLRSGLLHNICAASPLEL